MNQEANKLVIAFESEKLSYSHYTVDLYNTGITQILSVAASRGHDIYHFSMADLYRHNDEPLAKASHLVLPDYWEGDPVLCYQHLQVSGVRPLKLSSVDICFARGDDIKDKDTPHLDLLQTIEKNGVLIESIQATLSTTDKYELTRRVPHIPQPLTFAADTVIEAMDAVNQLPKDKEFFILKDRYGYGCGMQVHRIRFDDPELENCLVMYISNYKHVVIQEFCPEVRNGDLVITFFDGELIAPLCREPAWGEWKTNLSFGANQRMHVLTEEQEHIARDVISAFPEIRYAAVDMLTTGKVLEINAFPGGQGLYDSYGISVGKIVLGKLESELLGLPAPPEDISAPLVETSVTPWSNIYKLYEDFESTIDVFDVFSRESYTLHIHDLIDFTPRTNNYILSVPHSGILIPEAYRPKFDLGPNCLKEIDLLSDILYEGLDGLQVVCRLAPFFVDMNRSRDGDKDDDLPSHLTNPATEYYTIENKTLLNEPYNPQQEKDVLQYYDLYHDILEYLTDQMIKEKGYALIIDAHTMSSVGWGRVYDEGKERSNFVVGTLDDQSADSEIIHDFVEALKSAAKVHKLGLSVSKNKPYGGGFITRKHHDPENYIHVIQLEVTMDTYMYEPVEEEAIKRYALKQPRLKMVQDIVSHAISAACTAAERIHR